MTWKIWNLNDPQPWDNTSTRWAKPRINIYCNEPDYQTITEYQLRVRDTSNNVLHTQNGTGSWAWNATITVDVTYALHNGTPYRIDAQIKDSYGVWSGFGSYDEDRVRWGQAIFQHQTGIGAGQFQFTTGALTGGTAEAFYLYRGAKQVDGGTPTAWSTSISSFDTSEYGYTNILVRLAKGNHADNPSLSDMTLQYLGSATSPEKWQFSGFGATGWALDPNIRRYGTQSLRFDKTADASAANIVLNPSFTTDLTSWTLNDATSTTRQSTGGYSNGPCLQTIGDGTGTEYVYQDRQVDKYKRYRLSAWVSSTVASSALVSVTWLDSGSNVISSETPLSNGSTTGTGVWVGGYITAPATAAFARVVMSIPDASTATSKFDDVTLYPAHATASTYNGGNLYCVPVISGTTYTMSAWVKGTISAGELVLSAHTQSGSQITSTEPVTDTSGHDGGWQRVSKTFVAPAGQDRIRIDLAYFMTSTATGDAFNVDAIQLEEGPVASAWNPGQTGAVVLDVGGVEVDASRGATFRLRGSTGGTNDVMELHQKGIRFGNKWEVYSDGTSLLASDGTDIRTLSGTAVGVGAEASIANQNCAIYWARMVFGAMTRETPNEAWVSSVGAGVFTVGKAGWYVCSVWANVSLPSGTLCLFGLTINGNREDHANGQAWPGAGISYDTATWLRYLPAGATVAFDVYNTVGTVNVTGGRATIAMVGGASGAKGDSGADGETVINNIDPTTRSVGARAYSSGYQVANSTTWTTVNLAATMHDTDGFWSASLPTRMTVPANCPSGIYRVEGTVRLENHTAARFFDVILQKNGVWQQGRTAVNHAANGAWQIQHTSIDLWLNPGDYMTLHVYHDEGAACYIGETGGNLWDCNGLTITYLGSGSAAGTAVEGTNVTRSTAQTYTAGQTAAVSFDGAVQNQGGWWAVSPDPTRITVTASGWYTYEGSGEFAPPTTAGRPMYLYAKKGGTVNLGQIESTAGLATYTTYLGCSGVVYLTAGEYVELIAANNDTASKDLTSAKFRLVKMAAGADTTYQAPVITDAPGARVRYSAEQSIPNNTVTLVSFDIEDHDSHGFWNSGAPSRFIIPAGHAGKYRVYASTHFRGNAASFAREVRIHVNGSVVGGARDMNGTAGDGNLINCSADIMLAVGDYVEMWVYQNSGAANNAGWTGLPYQHTFSITRLATGPQGEKGDPGDPGDSTPSPHVITSSAGATTSGAGHYHFSHNTLVSNNDTSVFSVSVPGTNPITILAAGHYHVSTTLACATNAQMTLYVSKNGAEWSEMAIWQTSVPAGNNYMTKSGVFYLPAGTTIGTGIWDAGGAKVVGQHTVTVTAIRGYKGDTGPAGTVSATSGVTFPATQVPSTDANTLDDYEEGTWTPRITALSGGEATYSARSGQYQKVGKWVTCSGSVQFRRNTLSGQLTIAGLPFTVDSGVWHAGSIGYFAGGQNFSTGDSPMFYAEPGQTYCPMVAFRNSTIVAITDGTVPTGSDVHLIFQVRYQASL